MTRVVVLTPNPAVDVTYQVDRNELGTTVRVQRAFRRPGGKGVNVASVLRVLGEDPLALLPLGGANGRWVRTALEDEGLATAVVDVEEPRAVGSDGGRGSVREKETRTTVTVVDGIRPPTVYTESGPVVSALAWERVLAETSRRCGPGGWFVVAGSFPPDSEDVVGRLVRMAHASGSSVLVDTAGPALLLAADAGADVLKPNADEALHATGQPDLAGAARRLRSDASTRVVFSCGTEGLVGYEGGTVTRQEAVPDVAGNPTGAGDAATAGLVAALARGADLPTALRWAAVLGAAAVLAPVAGQVRLSDLGPLAARLAPGRGDRLHLLPPAPTAATAPHRNETPP